MWKSNNIQLVEELYLALNEAGHDSPTAIQKDALPQLLNGRDLIGVAQTGTGKTAVFALTILNELASKNLKTSKGHVQALILCPTRELAIQIQESFELYGKHLDFTCATVFGGVNEKKQIPLLEKGSDIVIATTGRFLDLSNRDYINFEEIKFFVLDEADRMLDLGFKTDVEKIISKLPEKRQNLLFSATMPEDISVLANSFLTDPILVEVTKESTPVEKINQKLMFVKEEKKPLILRALLQTEEVEKALIFVKTKYGANQLAIELEKQNIDVVVIHGDKSQTGRQKALTKFKKGEVNFLIATDIASRGIDIPDIDHVINYDLPQEPETYIHRIGRTARAEKEGAAITLYDELSESDLLQDIEEKLRFKIPVVQTIEHRKKPKSKPARGKKHFRKKR